MKQGSSNNNIKNNYIYENHIFSANQMNYIVLYNILITTKYILFLNTRRMIFSLNMQDLTTIFPNPTI